MQRFSPKLLRYWINQSTQAGSARLSSPAYRKKAAQLVVLLGSFFALTTEAADPEWQLCPPQEFLEPSTTAASTDQTTRVIADDVQGSYDDAVHFQGNVIVEQAGRQIEATNVTVTNERHIEARDGIRASDGQLDIRAAEAVIKDQDQESRFTDVHYIYKPRHASGSADEFISSGHIATLKNSTYSTCPPNKDGWRLKAKSITLNRESGLGVAKNAVFRFRDVPLFYMPVMAFPISDQRKSGFLFPEIGRSDPAGLQLMTPFYWNIAPQFDATLTPRYMSKRGLMLENEFRYLFSRHEGSIQANYLTDDDETGDERYLSALNHHGKPWDNWQLNLNGSHVSDDDYIEDFGSGLTLGRVSHLPRQADIRYDQRWYSLLLMSRAYQTIDPNIADTEIPYKIAPLFGVRAILPNDILGLSVSLDSEYSQFSHDVNTEGERLDLVPRISWRKTLPGWFVQPSLSWHQTGYFLEDGQIDRALPVTSLDSGMFFDRIAASGNIQTLEPRLFYLYAPDRDQDEIPLFDTTEPVFSFSSLFRENRFSGRDRIGDANQLTLALTSRYLEKGSNMERWRMSFGQIAYFADREVSLDGATVETDERSEFAAELAYSLHKWHARSTVVTDQDFNSTERFNLTAGYRDVDQQIFNIEHIYRRDDLQQSGISFAWPVSDQWRLLGRWLYSHEDKRDIDILAGLEYESCCWRARLIGQRFVTDVDDEYDNNFSLQLVFKGLASLGKGSELLQQRINGYDVSDE